MKNASVKIIRNNDDCEWLKDAITSGVLNGEALNRAKVVAMENAKLRKENAQLKRALTRKRSAISEYRKLYLDSIAEDKKCESEDARTMVFVMVGCTIMLLSAIAALIITVF